MGITNASGSPARRDVQPTSEPSGDSFGRATRLTADRAVVARPKLSPDGSLVGWTSRRAGEPEAFVMPTAGGLARQLSYFGSAGTSTLGFAPDGRLLVCSAGGQPAGWRVENHGVDPDIVVEFPPDAWAAGADPQLAAGVAHLLDELDRRPPRPMPDLDTRPSRRAPELPSRP